MHNLTINEGSESNNKENHNKHDLQKFHQNDEVGTKLILDTYAMHNLLDLICNDETVALKFVEREREQYNARMSVTRMYFWPLSKTEIASHC